jgi:hypothetical protein
VNGDLSQAAMLPLHRDTTCQMEAQLDESIAYRGVSFKVVDMSPPQDFPAPLKDREHAAGSRPHISHQKKSYRDILPLRQGEVQAGVLNLS